MSLRNINRFTRKLRDDLVQMEVAQDVAAGFGKYKDDPVGFVREVLGAVPESYQERILRACVHNPRVAVRSGHGIGKTTVLAWVILWFLLTRPFSRILMLAPAFERQVGYYLLPEVRKWARRAPERLPVDVRALSVVVSGYESEWFALGVQASEAALVEGGHAESLAVIADEAKGLNADVVAALHGTQTDIGGDRLYLMASTPGGPSGPFYDAFRSEVWKTFHVSSEDSALVSRTWIEERRKEWGEASPLYLARVRGEFPEEAEGTLLPLSILEAAVGRDVEEGGRVVLGVDPARFGPDRSAIAVWKGKRLTKVLTRNGMDTMATSAWVKSIANLESATQVLVDEIGLGAGVLDRLRQLDCPGLQGVNAAQRAKRPNVFANLRAEQAWRFREALEKEEIALPEDEVLLAELSALRFSYDSKGRIRLEGKEQIKRRVGRSPDLADAALLGYAPSSPRGRYAYMGGLMIDFEDLCIVERIDWDSL